MVLYEHTNEFLLQLTVFGERDHPGLTSAPLVVVAIDLERDSVTPPYHMVAVSTARILVIKASPVTRKSLAKLQVTNC